MNLSTAPIIDIKKKALVNIGRASRDEWILGS